MKTKTYIFCFLATGCFVGFLVRKNIHVQSSVNPKPLSSLSQRPLQTRQTGSGDIGPKLIGDSAEDEVGKFVGMGKLDSWEYLSQSEKESAVESLALTGRAKEAFLYLIEHSNPGKSRQKLLFRLFSSIERNTLSPDEIVRCFEHLIIDEDRESALNGLIEGIESNGYKLSVEDVVALGGRLSDSLRITDSYVFGAVHTAISSPDESHSEKEARAQVELLKQFLQTGLHNRDELSEIIRQRVVEGRLNALNFFQLVVVEQKLSPEIISENLTTSIVEKVAEESGVSIADRLLSDNKYSLLEATFKPLAEADPTKLVKWFDENKGALKIRVKDSLVSEIARVALQKKDPVTAFEWAEQIDDPTLRNSLEKIIKESYDHSR
jgi:hypothetical protein